MEIAEIAKRNLRHALKQMKQQTTEFFIETRERIVFRRTSAQEVETVCAACGAESVFIVPERAAFLFDLTTREIYRRIERGAIHFLETDAGATLVCAASLSGNGNNSAESNRLDALSAKQGEIL